MNKLFVTISSHSGPRGSHQGNYNMFMCKELRRRMNMVSIREQPTGEIFIREASSNDRKARDMKHATSIKCTHELRHGRHRVIQKGETFIVQP